MHPVNHLYNMFWEYLDKKVAEEFNEATDGKLDLEKDVFVLSFLSNLFEEDSSEFIDWVKTEWELAGLDEHDILNMTDVVDIVKYISQHKWLVYEGGFDKPDDFIQQLTVDGLFNHYGKAIVYFESEKVKKHVQNSFGLNNELRTSSFSTPKSPVKRKRDEDDNSDMETTNKKLKACDSYHSILDKIDTKMITDTNFYDWVNKGSCFRTYVTRPKPISKMKPGKLRRETNEPRSHKLARSCIKNKYSFEQIVNRFNYDMSRVDLYSVKTRLELHYPNATSSELDILAAECVNKLVHPDDYDFNLKEDIDEWNSRIDLIPNTPIKRRRSERLNDRKRRRLHH